MKKPRRPRRPPRKAQLLIDYTRSRDPAERERLAAELAAEGFRLDIPGGIWPIGEILRERHAARDREGIVPADGVALVEEVPTPEEAGPEEAAGQVARHEEAIRRLDVTPGGDLVFGGPADAFTGEALDWIARNRELLAAAIRVHKAEQAAALENAIEDVFGDAPDAPEGWDPDDWHAWLLAGGSPRPDGPPPFTIVTTATAREGGPARDLARSLRGTGAALVKLSPLPDDHPVLDAEEIEP